MALVSARVVGVSRLGEVGPEVHDLLAEDILIGREGEVEDPGRVENVDDLGPVAHPAVAEGDWAPSWKGQGVVPDVQPDVGESPGPHHTRGIARGAGEDEVSSQFHHLVALVRRLAGRVHVQDPDGMTRVHGQHHLRVQPVADGGVPGAEDVQHRLLRGGADDEWLGAELTRLDQRKRLVLDELAVHEGSPRLEELQ